MINPALNNGMMNGGMNNGMNSGTNGIGASSPNSLYNTASAMQSNPSMWIEFENGLRYIVSQKKETTYSINKQAGVVTLRAPLIIQKEVEEYIEKVKKVATAQILVEVRLVEVQLNDEFSTGINFSTSDTVAVTGNFGSSSTTNALSSTPFALTFSKGGLTAAVQFLQSFGTTKAIASPRLNVMNNQKSRLSFAKDQVYFSLQPQLQNAYNTINGATSTASNPIIVQSTIHTVPVGIILELQATADLEKNEITMNIHPVLSSIVNTVQDPAATFLASLNNVSSAASAIANSIPIIEKKELNSTLRIKSGEIMVIGGFNEEKTVVQRIGIPYLKDIPYLRVLFGSNTKSVHNVETVIFIKATIMTPENSIGEDDTKFYNDFA
jgi:general secretion pathway protein D